RLWCNTTRQGLALKGQGWRFDIKLKGFDRKRWGNLVRRGGARDLRGNLRKFADADLVALGQHDGAENRVLELAHVPRPAIGGEQRQRLARDAADAFALFGGEAGEKMAHQFRDILGPLAQRRDRDGEDVQPVKKVLAEA